MRRVTLAILLCAAFAAALCPPALAVCCFEGNWDDCRDEDCDSGSECCRDLPRPDVAAAPDVHVVNQTIALDTVAPAAPLAAHRVPLARFTASLVATAADPPPAVDRVPLRI